ncbi:MAG: FAD-dependent oxidoreductase, partial [Cellvibrionaceae bacterium]|nr:FAD-dependent oxidoreductase [Cellvibrionaceae bacterium]
RLIVKVAIIGAGIAGLSAAQALKQVDGAQVTVFEKSYGLGGRITTKSFDWGDIDIGAQYFTARDAVFQQQVDNWVREGAVAPWDFTPFVVKNGTLSSKPDQTIRYVATPTMNRLAFGLGLHLKILLGTRVTCLRRSGSGWRIDCDSGHKCEELFDWVIVALPAEQAAQLLCDHVLFRQIPAAVHVPCWALAFATCGGVAPEIQGVFGDSLVSWVSRLSSRPKRQIAAQYDDCWMLHFSSEYSARHAGIEHDHLLDHGLTWLSQVFNTSVSKPLRVMHSYSHYWRYARLKDPSQQPGVLVDRDQHLAAIGDWCYGGRIEGAYLSGTRLVDQLFK